MCPIVPVAERQSIVESREGGTIASTQGVAAEGQLVIARGGLLGERQIGSTDWSGSRRRNVVATRGTAPCGVAPTL